MERSYGENITTKLKINNFETRHHLHRIFVFVLCAARDGLRAELRLCSALTQQAIKKEKTNGSSKPVNKKCVHIVFTRYLSLSRAHFCSSSLAPWIQRLSKRSIKFAAKSISKLQIVSNVRQQRRLWLYFSIAQIQTNKQTSKEKKERHERIRKMKLQRKTRDCL